jgi:spore coat polysaccharide biosynthesis predicted glycosyltransferase SpsG
LPEDIKSIGTVALVDLWDASFDQINALRPLKVAMIEDDFDVHEAADLLFQPYLDGIKWGTNPIRTENGKKLRPYEEQRGGCRVLKGSAYIVLSAQAAQMRPNRESAQPLNVKKLLVTFGGTDGPGLAPRAYEILSRLINENDWGGNCTLLAPGGGLEGGGSPKIYVSQGLPNLTKHLPEYDAVWCAGGVTLAECLCLGVPVAAWPQNERQQRMITDIALEGACINLGIGTEADPFVVQEALADWLGPLGQETRQEQSTNGMALVDGSGATKVAQELWKLALI